MSTSVEENQPNISIVKRIFQGKYKSLRECLLCNKEKVSYEDFNTVSLPIPEFKNIEVDLIIVFYDLGKENLKIKIQMYSNHKVSDLIFQIKKQFMMSESSIILVCSNENFEIECIHSLNADLLTFSEESILLYCHQIIDPTSRVNFEESNASNLKQNKNLKLVDDGEEKTLMSNDVLEYRVGSADSSIFDKKKGSDYYDDILVKRPRYFSFLISLMQKVKYNPLMDIEQTLQHLNFKPTNSNSIYKIQTLLQEQKITEQTTKPENDLVINKFIDVLKRSIDQGLVSTYSNDQWGWLGQKYFIVPITLLTFDSRLSHPERSRFLTFKRLFMLNVNDTLSSVYSQIFSFLSPLFHTKTEVKNSETVYNNYQSTFYKVALEDLTKLFESNKMTYSTSYIPIPEEELITRKIAFILKVKNMNPLISCRICKHNCRSCFLPYSKNIKLFEYLKQKYPYIETKDWHKNSSYYFLNKDQKVHIYEKVEFELEVWFLSDYEKYIESKINLVEISSNVLSFNDTNDKNTSRSKSERKVREGIPLEDCLKAFSLPELLTKENKPFCEYCKILTDCRKTISICMFPDVLILQLKRFKIDSKLNQSVNFPVDGLKFQNPVVSGATSKYSQVTYNLISLSCHKGTLRKGHYYSIIVERSVPSGKPKFFRLDDHERKEISLYDISNSEVYVLVYQKAK